MAWYRAGGGGIPSSLKSDMNDVLNKKFGTSTDYPPTDWAPTVNLMGPLPEKTVSGAIVTFSDGADTVPLKKCEITLPASLDGYSEVDVVATGKNLLDLSNITNGDYSATGAEFVNNVVAVSPMTIKGGANYIMTCSSSVSGFYIRFYDGNDTEIIDGRVSAYNVTSKTFSTPANAVKYIPMWYNANGLTPADVVSKNYMIEAGSTPTTYEPYTAPTTHTADLGRTIYGGKPDVVNGQGVDNFSAPIALDTLTWKKENNHFYSNSLVTLKAPVNNTVPANIDVSSPYTNMAYSSMIGEGTDKSISLNNSKRLYIYDSEVTDTTELETALSGKYLVGELATPDPFTFDPVPIDSKLGNNTMWSGQGSAEVTYRADINLALGGQ